MSIVDNFLFRQYKSRRSFSFFEYKSKKRRCAPREREMTIKRIYHHGRIFRRRGPPSAAHPSLFSFVFCSMSSKEREVLFEEDSFFSLYVLPSGLPNLFYFVSVGQALSVFCSLRQKKKGIFLLRVCILDDASDLPRDILQFVLQERKERVFEKEPTEKHTSKEREREERERKRRKRPAIENFSTYSIKWWQQLSRNARFRNCSRSKFALQL